MIEINLVKREFPEIFRVFISGSSSSGKTFFARNLIAEQMFKCDRIYYFHPDINEAFPIDWEDHLNIPVLMNAHLPTLEQLTSYPKNSCLVIDDLYTEASKSEHIDYLFRVLSSKKKLHVIIMTQRYFAERGFSLNIRNSSNFHVLMTNSDARINGRVGHTMLLKPQIDIAEKENSQKLYPYIFIDRTNQARVSGLQVYTQIFGRYKHVIYNFMISVVISKKEFEEQFKIIDDKTAISDGRNKEKDICGTQTKSESETKSPELVEGPRKFFRSKLKQRQDLDRKIDQALRRYKQRTFL